MATASFTEDLKKELKCAICLELFKAPKMLPCLHTFCKKCVEELAEKSFGKQPTSMFYHYTLPLTKSLLRYHFNVQLAITPNYFTEAIVCPTCHTQHSLPSKGVEGFSTNFIAANLVELLSFHGDSTKSPLDVRKCENEIDDNPATSKCLDCDFYLCGPCTALHTKQRITKNHKLVSIAEIKSGEVKQLSQKRYCSEHNEEELKLYCTTCEKVICRDCIIFTHKRHNYTLIKNETKVLSKKLQILSASVTKKQKEIHSVIDHIQEEKIKEEQRKLSKMQSVEMFFGKSIVEVQARIADLQNHIMKLEQHQATVLQEFESASSSHIKQLTVQEEEVQLSCVRISSALSFSQQLVSSANSTDLAMMSQQACQQFQTLTKLPSDKNVVKKSPWDASLSEKNPFKSPVVCNLSDLIFVSGLNHSALLGKNTFNVNLMTQEFDVDVDVKVTLSSGKSCPVIVEFDNIEGWSVSYFISPPCPSEVSIFVFVNGCESSHSPFKLSCQNNMAIGTRVLEQTKQKTATVTEPDLDYTYSSEYVHVTWDDHCSIPPRTRHGSPVPPFFFESELPKIVQLSKIKVIAE